MLIAIRRFFGLKNYNMKIVAITATALLLTLPAKAQDLASIPSFDVESACRTRSHSDQWKDDSPNFNIVFNQCIQVNQDGYEYLKSVWNKIPTSIRLNCYQLYFATAYNNAFKYESLAQCIESKSRSYRASQTQQQQFQK